MGLTINLENERGKVLGSVVDPKNALHRLLREEGLQASCCLRFIDWYGDTIFNRLQMQLFLPEWTDLADHAISEEERQIIADVALLAKECRDDVHRYLRFKGD
jgi:hypothetical protein